MIYFNIIALISITTCFQMKTYKTWHKCYTTNIQHYQVNHIITQILIVKFYLPQQIANCQFHINIKKVTQNHLDASTQEIGVYEESVTCGSNEIVLKCGDKQKGTFKICLQNIATSKSNFSIFELQMTKKQISQSQSNLIKSTQLSILQQTIQQINQQLTILNQNLSQAKLLNQNLQKQIFQAQPIFQWAIQVQLFLLIIYAIFWIFLFQKIIQS